MYAQSKGFCLGTILLFLMMHPSSVSGYDLTVYHVQNKLSELGYNIGKVDGLTGKKTVSAIKDFQKNNDMEVDGKINEELKSLLGIKDLHNLEYNFSRIQLKTESNKSGKLVPLANKENFSSDEKANIYLRATVLNQTTKHHVEYQDIVYVADDSFNFDDPTSILPTLWYKGCPFALESDLEVLKQAKHRVKKDFIIKNAKNNILYLSDSSALPFIWNGSDLLRGAAMCINSVWIFENEGTTFNSPSASYTTVRPMAKIYFTSEGVKL